MNKTNKMELDSILNSHINNIFFSSSTQPLVINTFHHKSTYRPFLQLAYLLYNSYHTICLSSKMLKSCKLAL